MIWYLGINLDFACNATMGDWRFLSVSIMHQTLCPKISVTISSVDMSGEVTGQSMCTTLFLCKKNADSGEMCSGVVIIGLVLALVLALEMKNNRPQPLIHGRLPHQVSHYNHQICRPRVLAPPEGHGERYCTKTYV